jgi:hypothetical protein
VDHLPAKVLSAGCVIAEDAPHGGCDAAFEEAQVRDLAELEHRSWEVDRLLDGWSGGSIRDDRSRVNETIGVSYERLPPSVKQLDLEQVKAAAAMLTRVGLAARRERRIGLIGHNHVNSEHKGRILSGIQAIPSVAASVEAGALISLVTPLAPGSDLILAQSLAEALEGMRAAYRLVIVRTLPFEIVVSEFVSASGGFDEWSLRGDGLPPDPHEAASLIQQRVEEWLVGVRSAVVVNLIPPGSRMEDWVGPSNMERRRAAFRRANAYVVSRCHTLVAFIDETRAAGPGGTAEALAWARDGSSIPPAFHGVCGASAPEPEIVLLKAGGERADA